MSNILHSWLYMTQNYFYAWNICFLCENRSCFSSKRKNAKLRRRKLKETKKSGLHLQCLDSQLPFLYYDPSFSTLWKSQWQAFVKKKLTILRSCYNLEAKIQFGINFIHSPIPTWVCYRTASHIASLQSRSSLLRFRNKWFIPIKNKKHSSKLLMIFE